MSALQNEIGKLSATEKLELLDVLWQSLEADELPLTEAQCDELDFRLIEYERNPDDVVPWDEVRARVFGRK
ncbi:MAG: addiction module protein [Bryobacteraceae bacterium]